jgi:hypothetical protein
MKEFNRRGIFLFFKEINFFDFRSAKNDNGCLSISFLYIPKNWNQSDKNAL